MHFTLPSIVLVALASGALAGAGGEYTLDHYSSSHSATPTTHIYTRPMPPHSSSAIKYSTTSAVPSKSSSAVRPTKTAGGGSENGNGNGNGSGSGSGSESGSESGSGSGSGGASGEGGSSTTPPYIPGNPAAKIDAQGATYLGAALGALGAFAALI